jgi:hypothetical protein
LLGLILSVGWADTTGPRASEANERAFWRVGKPVPIAVREGRASFRAPARTPSSEILVVVSAIAREKGPFSIQLTARSATSGAVPSLAEDGVSGCARTGAEIPAPRQAALRQPAQTEPMRERAFHILVRDGDVYSPSNYMAVPAVLRGVGRRIQVYVARADVDSVRALAVDDIINTFDNRIFPLMASRFGPAPDVDGDGRFTVLLSSWLDHLGGGRYAVDGFVRVADLDRSFRPPLGNQCDVMYLSSSLESGPYLRTVLTHEYMHAVLFGQKGRGGGQVAGGVQEEEGWLDEAIAHLAEDSCGFSTSNIDYRVSAFLAGPERYQLVVDDYYAADLFRSHGNRGSTYLFLRWCAERYGPSLLPALVHSKLRGAANLEACTGATFAGLYRGWSLDLAEERLETRGENRAACGDQIPGEIRQPRPAELARGGPRLSRLASGSVDRWTALGTTSHYAIVDGSRSGAVEIEVSGPAEAELQVTAVVLGDDRPRLDLSVVKIRGKDGEVFLRANIKERHGEPVELAEISWEPLAPGPRRRGGAVCCGRLHAGELAKSLGAATLAASGELTSEPIPLAGARQLYQPLLVKVGGTDAKGRRIWAWADLDL